MTTTGAQLLPAEDVRVGDDIVFLGKAHRITSIEDHQHPAFAEPWRIASDAFGWSITLVPGATLEVVR